MVYTNCDILKSTPKHIFNNKNKFEDTRTIFNSVKLNIKLNLSDNRKCISKWFDRSNIYKFKFTYQPTHFRTLGNKELNWFLLDNTVNLLMYRRACTL